VDEDLLDAWSWTETDRSSRDAAVPAGQLMAVRVAVLDDYQSAAAGAGDWAALAGVEVDFVHEHLTGDALVERIAGAAVVVAMRERTPITRSLLARLPALRMLVTTGMRNASIDVAAVREHGVLLTGTGSQRQSTAELTWALILGLIRPVARYDATIRAGGWQESVDGDLAGRTLGLVGLGRQGAAVAKVGLAFGMDVVAWSQNLTAEHAAAHGARLVSRADLFAGSDIVSLHLVLSDRSRALVGHGDLRAMRPDAYLVNTARAGLIDQTALRTAVEHGWLRGVALDVYDIEPLPADHWLRTSERTLLTPHMGYVSAAGYARYYGDAIENIAAYLAGTPIRELP
jgi:phosphoglycerate dehydrogenase-like enzyme